MIAPWLILCGAFWLFVFGHTALGVVLAMVGLILLLLP